MKVIHVPYVFHPDPVGGTEIYVESLARLQGSRGVEALVAAPGDANTAYDHQGLRVRRFARRGHVEDVGKMYGAGDEVAAAAFARIVDEERPDVVHLHAYSPAVSLRLAREVKARGVPLVLTYHTPTITCQRATLLRWGRTPCDGVLEVTRCASCALHGLGVSRPVARILGRVPARFGRLLGESGLTGGPWTALRMTELTERRHVATRDLLQIVDRIVAPSRWVVDLLVANGVPLAKIAFCRQGLPRPAPGAFPPVRPAAGARLQIAFFGRLDPVKGPHVLIDALARIPHACVALDVFGVTQADDSDPYGIHLRSRIAADPRIRLLPAVANSTTIGTMSRYDVLAVPSLGFETGPLVVLEAFAAGVPVLGSDLGGIAERVTNGVNGELLPPGDVAAWAAAIERLAAQPRPRAGLRHDNELSHSMDDVCTTMNALYSDLASRRAPERTHASA